MTKYGVPVWKMCYEAARELPEVFRPIDIIKKIKEKRPEVKETTIRAHVIGLAPNHPSYRHYGGRHELFHYLGDGNFRLLADKETTSPYTPRERVEPSFVSRTSLSNAERLLNLGMYGQAITEYGAIMERLLKRLYTKYFPDLPVEAKEKIVSYEKGIKTPTNKFTMGQWIGLFNTANLFKHIAQEKKLENGSFVFFTPGTLDAINKLRNKSTHSTRQGMPYINRNSALFRKIGNDLHA
jgi:hypothetical protein